MRNKVYDICLRDWHKNFAVMQREPVTPPIDKRLPISWNNREGLPAQMDRLSYFRLELRAHKSGTVKFCRGFSFRDEIENPTMRRLGTGNQRLVPT